MADGFILSNLQVRYSANTRLNQGEQPEKKEQKLLYPPLMGFPQQMTIHFPRRGKISPPEQVCKHFTQSFKARLSATPYALQLHTTFFYNYNYITYIQNGGHHTTWWFCLHSRPLPGPVHFPGMLSTELPCKHPLDPLCCGLSNVKQHKQHTHTHTHTHTHIHIHTTTYRCDHRNPIKMPGG